MYNDWTNKESEKAMSGFLKSEYCTIFQTVVISTFPALRNCNKSQTLSLTA